MLNKIKKVEEKGRRGKGGGVTGDSRGKEKNRLRRQKYY